MIGGSADLTHSNNTKTKVTEPVSKAGFAGRYINYGVREHAMVAAMNGIATDAHVIQGTALKLPAGNPQASTPQPAPTTVPQAAPKKRD